MQIVQQLLDVEENPRKPQYIMAAGKNRTPPFTLTLNEDGWIPILHSRGRPHTHTHTEARSVWLRPRTKAVYSFCHCTTGAMAGRQLKCHPL